MEKNILMDRYSNIVLARESFGKNTELFAEDFITRDALLYRLQELNTHELSLTDEGVRFLDDYYGLNVVADLILQSISEGVDYKYKTKKDLIAWLQAKGDVIQKQDLLNP